MKLRNKKEAQKADEIIRGLESPRHMGQMSIMISGKTRRRDVVLIDELSFLCPDCGKTVRPYLLNSPTKGSLCLGFTCDNCGYYTTLHMRIRDGFAFKEFKNSEEKWDEILKSFIEKQIEK